MGLSSQLGAAIVAVFARRLSDRRFGWHTERIAARRLNRAVARSKRNISTELNQTDPTATDGPIAANENQNNGRGGQQSPRSTVRSVRAPTSRRPARSPPAIPERPERVVDAREPVDGDRLKRQDGDGDLDHEQMEAAWSRSRAR